MSEKIFWDKFYKKHNKTSFEWIIDTSSISEILNQIDQCQTFILDAGCGSSLFSTRLSQSLQSFNFLLCSDFSLQGLEIIRSNRDAGFTRPIDFVQCDCKNIPIRDSFFDIILGKNNFFFIIYKHMCGYGCLLMFA